MNTLKGTPLQELPMGNELRNCEETTDLIFYDGPFLTHFPCNGADYLMYWVDTDQVKYNRWLLFDVWKRKVDLFLSKKESLHSLLNSAIGGVCYKVDVSHDNDDSMIFHNVMKVQIKDLPADYLPDKDSYWNENDQIDYEKNN